MGLLQERDILCKEQIWSMKGNQTTDHMFILKKQTKNKLIPQNVPHSYTLVLLILKRHLLLSGMMVCFFTN